MGSERRDDAGQVLLAYLADHAAALRRQDVSLRAGETGSVHQLRIAARRLRSALRSYGPLFQPASTDRIGDDLRWLGQSLSAARDAQVLRAHLPELVAAEPPELVLGPVMSRIDDELRTAERTGREQALQALDSERYLRL
ncbi:MAG: CHAD domain-containing protein, partial [Aeromicrobium sp.]